MFRNILKLKNSTNGILRTLTQYSSHGMHTKADKKSFLRAWAKMSESSRKQTGLFESEPEFAEVVMYRGHAFRELGEFKGAIESYKQAMNMDKTYAEKAKNEIAEITESSDNDRKCRR